MIVEASLPTLLPSLLPWFREFCPSWHWPCPQSGRAVPASAKHPPERPPGQTRVRGPALTKPLEGNSFNRPLLPLWYVAPRCATCRAISLCSNQRCRSKRGTDMISAVPSRTAQLRCPPMLCSPGRVGDLCFPHSGPHVQRLEPVQQRLCECSLALASDAVAG